MDTVVAQEYTPWWGLSERADGDPWSNLTAPQLTRETNEEHDGGLASPDGDSPWASDEKSVVEMVISP